jgi:hypothetical protein
MTSVTPISIRMDHNRTSEEDAVGDYVYYVGDDDNDNYDDRLRHIP